MPSRWLIALLLLVLLAGFGQTTPATPSATIGTPAPPFDLVDTAGRRHTLSAYKGRIVVLEWINPDCPYVKRQYESRSMPDTIGRVRQLDPKAVWLSVNSTKDATTGANLVWRRRHALAHPVLLDADGVTGRRYDARRTPEIAVIDAEGRLRYRGAIDDNRLGRTPRAEVTNYVVDAVRQIVEGATVRPDYVRPYGCKIKYAR